MKNLKTTLVSVAALSAVALTSFAQEQAKPAAPAAPAAPAVQPAAKTVSTTVKTKYGNIKITDIENADGDIFKFEVPMLPKNVNQNDFFNVLMAVAMSIVDEVEHKNALAAFAASIPSLDLGDIGGKTVDMNASFPNAGKPNIEIKLGNEAIAFSPEVNNAGEIVGNVEVTKANGAKASTAVQVKPTATGVTGKVGGSNVTTVAPSASAAQANEVAPVEVPNAQESISAANNSANDTVGENKGISPDAE